MFSHEFLREGEAEGETESEKKEAETERWGGREGKSLGKGHTEAELRGLRVGEPETLLRQRLQGQFPQQRGHDHAGLLKMTSQSSFIKSVHCLQTMFKQVLHGAKSRFEVFSDV